MEQIPVDRLVGPGVMVDIVDKVEEQGLDTELEVADLAAWEEEHGAIPWGAVVIVHTGHGRFYTNASAYWGRPAELELGEEDTEHLHFPGVSEAAARWLVEERGVRGVGLDTPSTDLGQSRTFPTHRVLSAANVWGLENLADTEDLPPRGFTVLAMVHRLEGGSGGPARVVAWLEEGAAASGALMVLNPMILLVMFYNFM